LTTTTGQRLPATLIFDHPTPTAVAQYLRGQLTPQAAEDAPSDPVDAAEAEVRRALATVPLARLRQAGVLDTILRLAKPTEEAPVPQAEESSAIAGLAVADLVRLALDGADRSVRAEGSGS
ncbi:acyl carrier protein, partial [Streptomyces hainanensis]|uniref:acyl carrier protein n=1 Tax=Streptomyces hainanensis TaxID=402648 RepID=UPI001404F177